MSDTGLAYVAHDQRVRATDYTVAVTTNVQAGTRYNSISKPVLVKLGNPDRIRFSIRGDAVVVEGADG